MLHLLVAVGAVALLPYGLFAPVLAVGMEWAGVPLNPDVVAGVVLAHGLLGAAVVARVAAGPPGRSPQTGSAAVAGGLIHYGVLSTAYLAFGGSPVSANWDGALVAVGAFVAIGLFLVGALPAVLLVESRLVTPALVVAGLLAVSAYSGWRQATDMAVNLPGPWLFYHVGWFVVFGAALATGLLEYGIRWIWRGLQEGDRAAR